MPRLSLLVDFASLLGREVNLGELLGAACERVAEALSAERATVWVLDAEREELVARLATLPELGELREPLARGIAGWVARRGESVRLDDAGADPRFDAAVDRATGYVTRSMLAAPIRERAGAPVRGVLQVLNHARGAFDADDARYLDALALQLGQALALTTLRADDARGPGLVLRGPFNRIVGRSAAMQKVYARIALAAGTEATVLLRGETGTGKGLLARAIHANSQRQAGPFVTLDCTTLAAELAESELFGHERGAFTGADRRVRGRLELSDGGTLFLDEIGDLPLALQGKLLRFLQERAFERVGGRETLQADARVVCATHRDLAREVAEGRFREDLYYRVRVVEIEVPPLRRRGPDEIAMLARHFADHYAERHGRPRPEIAPEAMRALCAHGWAGNVRELEHCIESAVVLSTDGRIVDELLPASARDPATTAGAPLPPGLPLEEVERRHVRATVEACGGNKTEAARLLGIGRNRVARLLAR
jgi:Nif-specific regulatory protein